MVEIKCCKQSKNNCLYRKTSCSWTPLDDKSSHSNGSKWHKFSPSFSSDSNAMKSAWMGPLYRSKDSDGRWPHAFTLPACSANLLYTIHCTTAKAFRSLLWLVGRAVICVCSDAQWNFTLMIELWDPFEKMARIDMRLKKAYDFSAAVCRFR